jgi:hypothetical protein
MIEKVVTKGGKPFQSKLAPVWDTLCLPVDLYRRDKYLKKTSNKVETDATK